MQPMLPQEVDTFRNWLRQSKGKRSLKHLGPKIWDSIDPSLYDISPPAFKSQLKDKLVNEYSDWLSYAVLWNYAKVRAVHLEFTDLCQFVMYHWY